MTSHIIYFAQHGLALNKADDPKRPLSKVGIAQTQNIANNLLHSKTAISGVFHSGKLRASQTAEIFADTLHINSAPADNLSPNDDVTLLAQNLDINHALYVGHLPHLDRLVAYLLTGNDASCILKLQNSAVVCLEKTENFYQLQWYLPPTLIPSTH